MMPARRPDRVLGGVHTEFWDWCAKGELRLQRCVQCGELSWPPVEACENCGSPALQWEAMSGRGRIVSWCFFEKDYYVGTFPMPWETILVELKEGPYFISDPADLAATEMTIGMPVVMAFIRCEDSHGSFLLPVFTRSSVAAVELA